MRSFILFLKRIGLQKVVGIFIALVLIIIASVFAFSREKVLPDGYQAKFDQAKYAETIPEIERWLESNPQDINAKELLAALYIQKSDAEPIEASVHLDKALKLLNSVLGIDGTRSEAYRLIGAIYMYKVDYVNAERNFKKAISVSEDTNMNARAGLAGVDEARGNWNLATAGYRYVLNKEPKNDMANLGMGRYYISIGRTAPAEKHARLVLDTTKNNASLGEAYHILATAMKINRQYSLALDYFKESLKYRPGNVHTLVLYGEAQIDLYPRLNTKDRTASIDSIISTVNKAIQLKPDYIHGYTLLYKVHLLQNKYSEANAIGKKIVSLLPSDTTLNVAQKKEYNEFYSDEITSVTVNSVKFTELSEIKQTQKEEVKSNTQVKSGKSN